jgi:Phosphotransferase enzyme family
MVTSHLRPLGLGRSSGIGAEANGRGKGTPPPPVGTWSAALLRVCAEAAGSPFTYAAEPTELDPSQGPWAFRFGLAANGASATGTWRSDPGPRWGASLIVRLAGARGPLEREAEAMRLARAGGGGAAAPSLIAGLDVDGRPEALWALVSEDVDGVALPELIGFNLHQSDDLLRGFAAFHDAIHRLPVGDLGPRHPVPVIVAADEVARIDAALFPAEHRWLEEHLPPPAPAVLCHGGFQPLCVYGPPPSAWADHGGPGRDLTATNWSGAVLAEPEFDVAYTLVAFWVSPLFAKNRAERTAIKMIRTALLNTYKLGYTAQREIDPDRTRFWQAFHALRGLARLEGAYDGGGSPFASQDRGPLPDGLATELHRHFRQLTRVR